MTAPRPKYPLPMYEAVKDAHGNWSIYRNGSLIAWGFIGGDEITESEARRWAASEELLEALKAILDLAPFAENATEAEIHKLAEAAIRRAEPLGAEQ